MPPSISNLTVDIAGFVFGVQQLSPVRPQPLSVVQIHGKCETPIGFAQSCPHCHGKVFEPEPLRSPVLQPQITERRCQPSQAATAAKTASAPAPVKPAAKAADKPMSQVPVAGGKAQLPPKIVHCPSATCGKEIAGQVEEKPYCPKCELGIPEDQIQPAYKGGGNGLVVLTADELAGIEKLRLQRGIYILQSRRDWLPSLARLDDVYQLVPNKGSEAAFQAFVRATQRTAYIYQAVVCTKWEHVDPTLKFERAAILKLDDDGETLLMITLHPERDIHRQPVAGVDVATDLLDGMVQLQHGLDKPFGQAEAPSQTQAAEALWNAIQAKREGGKVIIPPPRNFSQELKAVVAKMQQALPQPPKAKKTGDKASGKAKAKPAKEPAPASAPEPTPSTKA